MTVLPDNPLDQTFRCEHFACLLTHRACLRRQTETRPGSGKGRQDKRVPMHPHCASGGCVQGAENRESAGSFTPPAPIDRRKAPRLDVVRAIEEKTMPKGKPTRKRTCCESFGTRHLATCPDKGKPAAMRRVPAPAPIATSEIAHAGLPGMALADLLSLRDEVALELRSRLDRNRTERDALEAALAPNPNEAVRTGT